MGRNGGKQWMKLARSVAVSALSASTSIKKQENSHVPPPPTHPEGETCTHAHNAHTNNMQLRDNSCLYMHTQWQQRQANSQAAPSTATAPWAGVRESPSQILGYQGSAPRPSPSPGQQTWPADEKEKFPFGTEQTTFGMTLFAEQMRTHFSKMVMLVGLYNLPQQRSMNFPREMRDTAPYPPGTT